MKDRMIEYVKYHIDGDSDCNVVLMKKWADRHNLGLQDRFDLAYFFSITYCVSSGIYMFKNKRKILNNIDSWVEKNKGKIIFQSDRKYVRMSDTFSKCIKFYKDNLNDVNCFLDGIVKDKIIVLEKALEKVQKWFFFGRFSSYLFLETFIGLTEYGFENATIDWKNGDTATSGIMNLFGLDKSADYFDKNDKIPSNLNYDKLNEMLDITLKEISSCGGDNDVLGVETSLCAYRKFFKGTRYNGFYLDRQLEEIIKTNKYDEYKDINKELLEFRSSMFDKKYLGEISGWEGIRKEAKKLYKNEGIIL